MAETIEKTPPPEPKPPVEEAGELAYSSLLGKWLFELQDGSIIWQYDDEKWTIQDETRKLDDQVPPMDNVIVYDEAAPPSQKKRKLSKTKTTTSEEKRPPPRNTGIYLSNLPSDTTQDEIEEIISRYGVISEDLEGNKRIKLYKDKDGKFKGDATVIFFRPESVPLAIEMLDGTDLRLGRPDIKGKIHVEQTTYSHKGPVSNNGGGDGKGSTTTDNKDDEEKQEEESTSEKPQLSAKDKKKLQRRIAKLSSKISDWDEDEDIAGQPKDNIHEKRWNRIVILKHAYDPEELNKDVTAELDIKQDLWDGCQEIGPIVNVTLYNLEPDGIVSVKFKHSEDATLCVEQMNGRFFDGRQLEASIYDGKHKYRKSKSIDDSENQSERLKEFGEWLEKEG